MVLYHYYNRRHTTQQTDRLHGDMIMTSNRTTVSQALLFCSSGSNPHGSFLQSSSTVWLSATACVHVPKWRAASKSLSIRPPFHHVSFALPPPSIPTPISPAGRISAGQPRSSARCPRNSDMQFTWWNKCSQAHGAGPWPMRSARFQMHGPYPAQGRGSITARYLDNQRTHSTVFMWLRTGKERKESTTNGVRAQQHAYTAQGHHYSIPSSFVCWKSQCSQDRFLLRGPL